jgi:hypothetical protein
MVSHLNLPVGDVLGIRYERIDELQDVFFRADVFERIVVHRLVEVDCVQYLPPQFPAGSLNFSWSKDNLDLVPAAL